MSEEIICFDIEYFNSSKVLLKAVAKSTFTVCKYRFFMNKINKKSSGGNFVNTPGVRRAQK